MTQNFEPNSTSTLTEILGSDEARQLREMSKPSHLETTQVKDLPGTVTNSLKRQRQLTGDSIHHSSHTQNNNQTTYSGHISASISEVPHASRSHNNSNNNHNLNNEVCQSKKQRIFDDINDNLPNLEFDNSTDLETFDGIDGIDPTLTSLFNNDSSKNDSSNNNSDSSLSKNHNICHSHGSNHTLNNTHQQHAHKNGQQHNPNNNNNLKNQVNHPNGTPMSAASSTSSTDSTQYVNPQSNLDSGVGSVLSQPSLNGNPLTPTQNNSINTCTPPSGSYNNYPNYPNMTNNNYNNMYYSQNQMSPCYWRGIT